MDIFDLNSDPGATFLGAGAYVLVVYFRCFLIVLLSAISVGILVWVNEREKENARKQEMSERRAEHLRCVDADIPEDT